MSAEQTPDIAAVLAEHAQDFSSGPFVIGCGCGESFPSDDAHRAHVAAALAPVLAAAVREAEQRALREAVVGLRAASRPFETGLGIDFACAWLNDRADRIAEPVSHEAATSGEEASKA